MSTETETPLAGGSEEGPASLSQDDAASRIEALLDDPPKEEDEAPAGEAPSEEAEQQAEGEQPDAETKATSEDAKAADDDPEVILRDNTKVKLSELKRIAGDVAGEQARFQAKIQAVQAEFEAKQAQIAQQERLVTDFLPLIQAQIPPPPSEEQWRDDPIGAIQQEREHNAAVGRLRAMQAQAMERQKAVQAQQAQRMQEHLARESERLFEKLPELKDEGKRAEFTKDMFRILKAEGFSEKEIGEINDSRVLSFVNRVIAAEKAAANITAQKPVAMKKVANAAPIATPQRRVMPAEAAAQRKSEALERLRKTGRQDDAVAAIRNIL